VWPGGQDTAERFQLINQIFGSHAESRRDVDGRAIGFVSSYAATNRDEDFAETFMHYVYYPDQFRMKAEKDRSQFSSSLLWQKYAIISQLFHGLWFRDYGAIGGFG
jgi:hypothetical protein